MVGPNDFCSDICYQNSPEKMINLYEQQFETVLRLLRDNIPRTIVNVLHPPNPFLLLTYKNKKSDCDMMHKIECPCIVGLPFKNNRKRYEKILKEWLDKMTEIVNKDKFNNDNFTVNLQGFVTNLDMPKTNDGNTDSTFMSVDCFHLSQVLLIKLFE